MNIFNLFKKHKSPVVLRLIKEVEIGKTNDFETRFYVYRNHICTQCFHEQESAEKYFERLLQLRGEYKQRTTLKEVKI